MIYYIGHLGHLHAKQSRILEIIHKTQIDDVLNKTERKGSKLDERQTGRLARINRTLEWGFENENKGDISETLLVSYDRERKAPALIRGTDAWARKKAQENELEVAEMRMLRWMCSRELRSWTR